MSSLGMACFHGFLAIHLFSVIFGFGHGAIWPLYAACASDYFPQKYAGSVVGFWTFFLGIGLIFSPMVAGWIADVTGKFAWSFILALATSIISMFLLLPYRKGISFRHEERLEG
jgi:MFS family permease